MTSPRCGSPTRRSWNGWAPTISCLILTGRQDALAGYEAAWSLLPEFPRATFAALDLAGHWLGRVERPAPFHALLADWIDRMAIDAGGSDAGDGVP